MKFSERFGIVEVKDFLQVDSMDGALKMALWNTFYQIFFSNNDYNVFLRPSEKGEPLFKLCLSLWGNFCNENIADLPNNSQTFIKEFQVRYEYFEWFKVYDFIEFLIEISPLCNYSNDPRQALSKIFNKKLEKHRSGYRLVDFKLVKITGEIEIKNIENALETVDKYRGASKHLKAALNLFSNRENPDYRNSIKESISAVETICKVISGDEKDTLGKALAKIKSANNLHPSLVAGFKKLYGYTSDEEGIRHAMISETNTVNQEEAKFMLVACSAFVNYLKQKTF